MVAFTAAAPAQAAWQLPATDLMADAGIYKYEDVAVGPDGALTVVWTTEYDYEADEYELMVSTRPEGSNDFGPAQELDAAKEFSTEIATAPNGETTVIWVKGFSDLDGALTDYRLQAATRAAGASSFGPPDVIAEGAGGSGLSSPALAVGPDGNAEVTWTRTVSVDEDAYSIETASRPAGAPSFGAPETLDAGANGAALFSEVAGGPDGLTTVSWQRNTAEAPIMTATRPAGSSSFGSPVKVGNSPKCELGIQEVEIAADGRTTVVWYGEGRVIQEATRPAGSASFSSPVAISAPATNPGTLDRGYPELAFDPAGQTTVVWEQSKGTGNTIIQSATRPAGSNTFGPAADLSTRRAWNPELAIGPDGATTVVWGALPQSVPALKPSAEAASRQAGSNTFGAPVDLSAAYFFGGEVPRVVTAPSGKTTAIWNGQSDPGVFGAFLTDRIGESGQPSLGKPKVTGPSKVKVNKKATFQVQVNNGGGADATGVSVRAVGKGASATKAVGTLGAGKEKTVPVSIKFTKKGSIQVTFSVSAANSEMKSVKKTVKVS